MTYEGIKRIRANATEQYFDSETLNEISDMVSAAIDKQIPAKPEERLADMIYNELGEAEYFCSCGVSLICQQNYCDNCGQKIDWSK